MFRFLTPMRVFNAANEGNQGGTDMQEVLPDPTTVEGFGLTQPEADPLDADLKVMFDGLNEADKATQTAEAARLAAQTMTPEQQSQQVQSLQQQLQTSVAGLKLDDKLFGDDFDPTNKDQIRDVMTKSVQYAVMQAVGLAMFPVSKAMQVNQTALEQKVQQLIATRMSGNNEEVKLGQEFPLINDPQFGTLFKQINNTMLTAKKGYTERLKALKATAQRMSLNSGGSEQTAPADMGGGNLLTGADALNDLFKGM